jgi:methionyl-tRNA synthetase
LDPAELKWGELKEEAPIGDVKPIFPRLDKTKTMAEINQKSEIGSQKLEVGPQGSEAHSGQHATEADAVPGASQPESKPVPPQPGATEADAVPGAAGVANFIDITDFTKVELRVGQVLTAARIPKSDKLLLLTVDIGEEQPRQILAGIAEHYTPEEMVGRKIAVVANLKPRKMRGHESQGMLLAASVGEGDKPVLATFTEDVPNGARLK